MAGLARLIMAGALLALVVVPATAAEVGCPGRLDLQVTRRLDAVPADWQAAPPPDERQVVELGELDLVRGTPDEVLAYGAEELAGRRIRPEPLGPLAQVFDLAAGEGGAAAGPISLLCSYPVAAERVFRLARQMPADIRRCTRDRAALSGAVRCGE